MTDAIGRQPRERDRGLWRLLALPKVYTWFQSHLGVAGNRAQVAAFIDAHPRDRVLDIGCGPAEILEFLPAVDYIGVDLSPRYLSDARARYPGATFLQMDVRQMPADWEQCFDLVLAQGVLHHFNDEEAIVLLTSARAALKAEGRLITVDPAFAPHQHPVARLMARLDRGRHVRTVDQYQRLAARVFARTSISVRHDLMRIPYTHVLMECSSRREP